MVNSDLKIRTKDYALSVIRLFAELPKRAETQVMGRELLRSDTSARPSESRKGIKSASAEKESSYDKSRVQKGLGTAVGIR